MKGISILGSTGSIGVQTLDVVRLHPDLFRVISLAAGSNLDLLERQVRQFGPQVVSCRDEETVAALRQRLQGISPMPWLEHGAEGLDIAATAQDVDLVVGGLPGSTGLRSSFAAVEAGKDIALATKEVLVMAGSLFMASVARRGVTLLPVDSEQSAIFQCLQGNRRASIERLILTASGGPFRDMPIELLNSVTRTQALDHPRWKMGPKVTVDSATLMNKGLEVIEARWLFDVPPARIEVVIHPESIVHSMVEFTDRSILAQLGATDMRIPIAYALSYPERIESAAEALDFPSLGSLNFRAPDHEKFPLLKAAFVALEDHRQAMPIVLNAADEVAVDLFLSERIPFSRIAPIVLEALERIDGAEINTLADVEAFHAGVVDRVTRDWGGWGCREA